MKMDTFNPDAFPRLKQVEKTHFWFSVRRRYIYESIKNFVSPPAKVLEVGCGTGNVSSFLSAKGYEVTGYEYFPGALEIAHENFNKVRGDALALPFKEKSFHVAGLFDVIEHFDSDRAVLGEARRVIKPEGIIVLTVPARQELWGFYDVKARHKRRYSPETLGALLTAAGFTPLSIRYMFSLLYLPLILNRNKPGKGDKFVINPAVNRLLRVVFDTERIIARRFKVPAGTSLIAVGKCGQSQQEYCR